MLSTGARLGPYDIGPLLGAGGMGEVYRARDSRLNRDVALKVLPQAVTLDGDRLARFKREAQLLASLNHPNIAIIHGFEELQGVHAIVLELVDGPTLAERLDGGAIPWAEALPIARQIAAALSAAHEQGVIHRDLKPANIKLRPDGTSKVLDFGLAKGLEPSVPAAGGASLSPTITTPAMTQMGILMGTAAYMSPEQAKGRAADKRSDVWAFGCVLYEMLTGRRPFDGDDMADTLANVLKTEPEWAALPADVPAPVRALIRRCLTKNPRERIADLAAAEFVLVDPAALQSPVSSPPAPTVPPRRDRRWRAAVALAAIVPAVAFGAWLGWRLKPSGTAAPVARFSFNLAEGQQLSTTTRHFVAVSPDGTEIAHIGNNRIFLRGLDEFEAHAVPGTDGEGIINTPTFSPDGRSLAFWSQKENALMRVAVGGGAAVRICAVGSPFGVAWDDSGLVIGQGNRGIVRCPSTGGTPEELAKVGDTESAHGPQRLANGSLLLFTLASNADGAGRWDKARIILQDLKTGARRTLVNGGTDGRVLPTGHLLYSLGGIVFAAPFSVARQELTGAPTPVVDGVMRPLAGNTGAVQLAISSGGTLVYVPGPTGIASNERALATADGAGAVSRLTVPPGPYTHVRASRDGTRLAIGSEDGKEAIVSIQDLRGSSAMRRLTFGGRNRFPIWSPDGERVAFQSDRDGDLGIYVQRADGNGPVERLTTAGKGDAHVPESWSPDGRYLSVSVVHDGVYALRILSLPDKTLRPFGHVESNEPTGSVFSPDGRWIAYASTPTIGGDPVISANRGVYIEPFPATGARYQVPKQQLDFHPVWSARGNEIFFVPTAASGHLSVVTLTMQSGIAFGRVSTLTARVTGGHLSSEPRAFDILPDDRFVGILPASERDSPESATPTQIRVVLNWFEELKQRVPAGQ